jgi:transposase
MECHIGRFLRKLEVVHHRNSDRTDNRIENLELFESVGDHTAEHARMRRADPALIERVRKAAADRSISFASLGMAPNSVAKICKEHGIKWQRRGTIAVVSEMTEQSVREALRGRTTLQAAALLHVHPMTLYNHFGHLLNKRTKPGTLDAHCVEVLQMLRHERRPQSDVAAKYGVSEDCVRKSVQRWMNNPEGLDLPPQRLRAIFRRWSKQDAKSDAPARQSTRHWSQKPGPKRKAPDKAGSSREPHAALPAS